MCPSSQKLYQDDFPFFGSPLARLEPELELFEVWDDGDDDHNHDHDDGGDCVNCLGGDDSEDKGKTKRLTLTRALSLTTKPQNMQGDAPLCRV